jgi:hypothetical protein
MALPAFLKINISCIPAMCFPYGFMQAYLRFRHSNEMYMVGHQAVRPDLDPAAGTPLGHQMQIFMIIGFTKEGLHPSVSALCNMVGYAWSNNPC